jgi:probable rRNA maturation factor
MSRILAFRNRQRTRALNLPLLRRITRWMLEEEFQVEGYELCFHLVEPAKMAEVNWQFLQHEGSTDVITFDHGAPTEFEVQSSAALQGEIFISVADAVKQAREFRTTWQSELTRYVIHSLLHLRGYDDLKPAARKVMKREENRLVKRMTVEFPLRNLARTRSS